VIAKEYESTLRTLIDQAWDTEVRWAEIEAWLSNFNGQIYDAEEERNFVLFMLSRFMYFSQRIIREMLKAVYRDQFESPLLQRIRRNYGNSTDFKLLRQLYQLELESTRFIGVGNPAESGAHLLYYFRQVNHLRKDLFTDIAGAFIPVVNTRNGTSQYIQREPTVNRYVFFDDLVGSGTQASDYLKPYISLIRNSNPNVELRFMSLFATRVGLEKLSSSDLFNGQVSCLFELDDSFKAFEATSRYFTAPPDWFSIDKLKEIVVAYGKHLNPTYPLGYKNGQLLLGFAHNTPDNAPPIFWDEGRRIPWSPIFIRYDKAY
jgi:hypothetical protein